MTPPPLLLAAQFIELLWIVFTYLGLEHAQATSSGIRLDYIPYSHSIVTGLFLAGLAWGFGKSVRRTYVGTAIALAAQASSVRQFLRPRSTHQPGRQRRSLFRERQYTSYREDG